jgi:hypothetical protein
MQQSFSTKANDACFALASWMANNDDQGSEWLCLHFDVLMSVSSANKSLLSSSFNTVDAIESMYNSEMVLFQGVVALLALREAGSLMPSPIPVEIELSQQIPMKQSDLPLDPLSLDDSLFGLESFGEEDVLDVMSLESGNILPCFSVELQPGVTPVVQPIAQPMTQPMTQFPPPPPPPPPVAPWSICSSYNTTPSNKRPRSEYNQENNVFVTAPKPRYRKKEWKIPKVVQKFSAIGACIYISQRIIGVSSYQDYVNHGGFSKIIAKMVSICNTDPVFIDLRKGDKQMKKNFERDLPMVIPGTPSKHKRTYVDDNGNDGMPTLLKMFDTLYKKKGGKMTWLADGMLTDEEL